MSIGKKLLVFSPKDEHATDLVAATSDWGCLVTTCETLEQFRGRLEGGDFDIVLCEESATLKSLIAESDPGGEILRTPLAEIEKRHILRVLSATNGNKTRAAKILGISLKTLYNRLNVYEAAQQGGLVLRLPGKAEGIAVSCAAQGGVFTVVLSDQLIELFSPGDHVVQERRVVGPHRAPPGGVFGHPLRPVVAVDEVVAVTKADLRRAAKEILELHDQRAGGMAHDVFAQARGGGGAHRIVHVQA